jgi:hypothetical protein
LFIDEKVGTKEIPVPRAQYESSAVYPYHHRCRGSTRSRGDL